MLHLKVSTCKKMCSEQQIFEHQLCTSRAGHCRGENVEGGGGGGINPWEPKPQKSRNMLRSGPSSVKGQDLSIPPLCPVPINFLLKGCP